MAKNKKHQNKKNTVPKRQVIQYFDELDIKYGTEKFFVLRFLFIYLFFFSFLGLVWMIPFPQFEFLVRMEMHTFFNWASILIAIIIYTYLKLAPTLSYLVLASIFLMSYFIVQLEYNEAAGGIPVWLLSFILLVISLLALLLLPKKGKPSFKSLLLLLGIGPIWTWSKVFDRFKWNY